MMKWDEMILFATLGHMRHNLVVIVAVGCWGLKVSYVFISLELFSLLEIVVHIVSNVCPPESIRNLPFK